MDFSITSTCLKAELKHLASIFDEKNQRFQIISKSADEVSCVFIVNTEKRIELKANLMVSI